jgi:hypothetical protein
MSLKDKISIFTSLDYPDGGSWIGGPNQRPLMTKPLIDFSGNIQNTIDIFTEGFIRGGAATHIERNLTDLARITKFLITPNGISFIAKQIGLQLSNPKISEPSAGITQIFSDADQRTYTPLTTLASVATAGTGIYFDREGLIPGFHEGYINAKGGFLGVNLFEDYGVGKREGNRLLFLYKEIIRADEYDSKTTNREKGKGEDLYDYWGGPDSLYGIGTTSIKRYTDTGGAIYYNDHQNKGGVGKTPVENFLKAFKKPYFNYNKKTKDQERGFHRETRIGLGDPGANYKIGGRDPHIFTKNKNGDLNYNVYDSTRVDQLNMRDITKITNGDFSGDGFRDLIRFRFEAIDQYTPTQADAIVFRAFLDDFNDNYSANHNEIKYNGRAESFYTYNSFKRDISFSFKIAAQTRHEMMPLYRKLNFLVSNTAPEYSTSGRIMTPYMRITVGSYLNRIPGVLSSVGISWQKDYPWEISIDSPEGGMDSHMLVLPHVLDVKVNFTPIHNFLPKKSVSDSPFILPHWDERDGTLNAEQKWLKVKSEDKNKTLLKGVERLRDLLSNEEKAAIEEANKKKEELNERNSNIGYEDNPEIGNRT